MIENLLMFTFALSLAENSIYITGILLIHTPHYPFLSPVTLYPLPTHTHSSSLPPLELALPVHTSPLSHYPLTIPLSYSLSTIYTHNTPSPLTLSSFLSLPTHTLPLSFYPLSLSTPFSPLTLYLTSLPTHTLPYSHPATLSPHSHFPLSLSH